MKVEIPPVQVVSFDIFDTLLYRITGEPESVFTLMERRLEQLPSRRFDPKFVKEFRNIRKNIPLLLSKKKGVEISFDEIYSYIGNLFSLSSDDISFLKDLEVDIESSVLKPINENLDLLNSEIKKGKKVIITSDMYLPQKVLRQFLAPYVLNAGKDIVFFVSNEYRKTKRSGQLFAQILKELKIKPHEIVHLGDDWEADVVPAQDLGMLAMHRPKSLPDNERLKSFMATKIPSICAATNVSVLVPLNNPVSRVGSTIAGPLLTSFVYWVMKKTEENNIKTLFFLARDGKILKRIAEIIFYDSSIKFKYLKVSRFSVVTASYWFRWDESSWSFILLDVPKVAFSEVAQRMLLSPKELYLALQSNGFRGSLPDTVNESLALFIKSSLKQDSDLLNKIKERAFKKCENLLKYLEREGFFEQPSALVDVGWKGTIQDFLYDILNSKKRSLRILGLYFGLAEYTDRQSSLNKKDAYAFYPYSKCEYSPAILRFLEIFTHANEPSTLGYDTSGEPILKDSFSAENKQKVTELDEGIIAYANKIREMDSVDLCFAGEDYFYYLQKLENPDKELAEALGDYCYLLGTLDNIVLPIAPKDNLFTFIKKKLRKEVPLWPGGYLARQSNLNLLILNLAREIRRLTRKHKK